MPLKNTSNQETKLTKEYDSKVAINMVRMTLT